MAQLVGEYAAHDVTRANNLRSAVAEGSYATGLWRNADVVTMSSYAPLLANVARHGVDERVHLRRALVEAYARYQRITPAAAGSVFSRLE